MTPLKRASFAAMLAGLSIAAASCGSRTAAPHDRAKGGDGVLRVGLSGQPRTLNPNLALDDFSLILGRNIFSKLLSMADDGTILPELAARWTESADGMAYTFYLRKGVRFHDGRALTSADVGATLTRLHESAMTEMASRIAGVETPDPLTVVVRLKTPWAGFLPYFGWVGPAILPAHVWTANIPWKENPANMRPIGSGPFRFRSWTPGHSIVLEKNPDYFDQGPYVDGIDFENTRTPQQGVEQLLAGQLDLLMDHPPAEMLRQLAHTPGIRVATSASDGRTYLAFNLRRPPFQDQRLRRAVNMAMDRRAMIDSVLLGFGSPATGFYTPAVGWAYDAAARAPPYDLSAARRLVAEALPRGSIVHYLYLENGEGLSPLAVEIVRQLRAAGFPVEPDPAQPHDYLPRLFAGDFDVATLSGSEGPDPDALSARFGSAGSMQVMGYANPELDAALARGGRVTDPVERAAAYFKAQEILAHDLPIAPLFETVRVSVFRDGLRGLPDQDALGLVPGDRYNLVRRPHATAAKGAR